MAGKSCSQVAVYAGTFDPISNGHRDIAIRAAMIFDRVVVAVAESTLKEELFSTDERVELFQGALSGVEGNFHVEKFDGLLVDYVRSIGARVIIRGLRAVSDYEYEAQMALANRQLAEEIETVFLMTSDKYSFVSSSTVRQIAMFREDLSSFVPANVEKRLREVYSSKQKA